MASRRGLFILSLIFASAMAFRPGRRPSLPTAAPLLVTPPAPIVRDYWVRYWADRVPEVSAALALQVARAENWRGVRDAWSPTGCCVGVMQVHVRFHYGQYDAACGGSDLLSVRDNACYGVMILRDYLRWCAGRVAPSLVERCAIGRYGGASTAVGRAAYVAYVRGYGASPE